MKSTPRATLSKSARTVRRGRVLIISGTRLRVTADPTTEDDPLLGTLYVFRCEAEDDSEDASEIIIRRSPNAKLEVER